MKVSIVTPTMSRPHYLRRMINSIINQDYDNWELIVIDEKEAIEPAIDLINQFDDPRIKLLFSDKNLVSPAIDMGFKAASGELITLLCDDDLLYDEYSLSSRVQIFEDMADFGLEFLYCTAVNQRLDGGFINEVKAGPVNVFQLWQNFQLDTMALMWKRELFDRLGYWNPEILYADDQEWKCRCLMEACCIGKDIKVVKHSQHANQISRVNKQNGNVQREKIKFKNELFNKYKRMFA
jgi:glycosyltransferase involved in cell wall biosynthesis